MINTVIVDDQQESIDDLIYLINKHKLPINVLATATSGAEGLAAILKHKPALIFLDVVMPGMSGFEMLELIPKIDFQLIITTSVDKYAIQAIRSSALDFLLKPIKPKELIEAINRCNEQTEKPSTSQINLLKENLTQKNKSISKIALSISDGIELVSLNDILYFESDGNYTTVHMKGDKQIVVSKPIGKFEEITDPQVFYRLHNSYLVNLGHVSKFVRSDGGYVVLDNGKVISVSRNKKDAFLEVLAKL